MEMTCDTPSTRTLGVRRLVYFGRAGTIRGVDSKPGANLPNPRMCRELGERGTVDFGRPRRLRDLDFGLAQENHRT
jgi:hypothetical protein